MMTSCNRPSLVDRISDCMIETMQEIVKKLNKAKAERRFIPMPDVYIVDQDY
jgi:hypothetical protein